MFPLLGLEVCPANSGAEISQEGQGCFYCSKGSVEVMRRGWLIGWFFQAAYGEQDMSCSLEEAVEWRRQLDPEMATSATEMGQLEREIFSKTQEVHPSIKINL